ncbi:hypothetical protein [Flavobacterium ustbae]|uniref:hypothetical protein n=1 Tax=Flavobacterium ustbae TaxID=2488790 RepID=UPI000F773A94|nr:hypothetical protein [Flavobacterium ustbae]
MNRLFIGVVICFLLTDCNKKKDIEENIPYIVSKERKGKITGNDTIPPSYPIPGWLVYGTNTFIIDSDTTMYYFQRPAIGMICGTPTADTIPHFINLHPKDLILLSNKNIYQFIKLNYKDDFRNVTYIASKSDTINSKAFFDLKKSIISFTKYRDIYIVRRTTQEEDTVLKYKKGSEYYNSEDIKWDKNRITFPFSKPKLQNK